MSRPDTPESPAVCRSLPDVEETAGKVRKEVAELCLQYEVPGIGKWPEPSEVGQGTF